MVMEWLYIAAPALVLLVFVILAFVIFLIILWIWMIVDCLVRDFKEGTSRVAWILVLIFLSFIGAILYYFIIYRKAKEKKTISIKRKR